ncbi:TetR/AcrR family transcriptional regulator [Mycobacteroides franklinii]|uniref:TetR/AcrR family transcriptional regulator n=1 Tax=Mycobacteroides franklinii TaxID=948102 RepID=A0A4R5P8I1_9MYCO|nr:TetR/AcrR family transcriptional regulator [Mycobacteroides franklinii]ORA58422.1 TetR family transcriptional regulator [Mycobacteroides franklinii]TDH20166.1 TetR/AcrR family transcriptional regulator [Mycobacteroides franklinii]
MSATTLRDRNRTRIELIDATRRLIDSSGRTKFAVKDVCDSIGYTRGAFYSSFASMDDHLVAVHERQNADLTEAVAAALAHARSVVGDTGDLVTFVNTFISTIAVDRGRLALQSALTARAQHNPHLADQLTVQRDHLRQTLEPYLLDVIDCAGRELTTDTITFTRAVMAAQSGAASQLIAADDPDDIRPLLVATTMIGLSRPRTSG